MRRKPPPRLHDSNYRGVRRYFLTICARDRARLFASADLATLVVERLRVASGQYQFAVIAYCIMPDHVHLLVEGMTDESDLREFVRGWKQGTAFAAKRTQGLALWQRGYYEHILRSEESTVVRAAYVLTNPVRAGLVRSAIDYPWSGSFVTTVEDLLERAQMQ